MYTYIVCTACYHSIRNMYVRTICTVFMSTQYVKHVYTQNISSVHVYTMCETYIYIQKEEEKWNINIHSTHSMHVYNTVCETCI